MVRQQHTQTRNAEDIQVWLVGGGIASLAAAVFLIHDARIPPSHIHIFEVHSSPGGAIASFGDPATGYVLHEGRQISFHDTYTERFLSLVPSVADENKMLWDEIRDFNLGYQYQTNPSTRTVVEEVTDPKTLDTGKFGLTVRDRLELIRVMLESEHTLSGKKISDVFHPEFFSTKFWMIWATTFVFSPQHSALELRRYLRKFLYDIVTLKSAPIAERTRYTQYESIIQPVTEYLEKEGVDFRLNEIVVDIEMDMTDDPISVSKIKYQSPTGLDLHITVEPNDLTFVTLGSIRSGAVKGTNTVPADVMSSVPHDSAWSLWNRLSQKNPKFGNPYNFSTHIKDSTLLTFTMTMKNFEFFERIRELIYNLPSSQPALSLADSRWLVSLDIPCQPVFHGQPADVGVIWGWALHPERSGNYVKKPMFSCSGEEITMELLHHLHFPLVPTLSGSITIPCINPLSTAPLLTHTHGDRPAIIPHGIANVALLGQFVEIADEATLSIEYSVRGAQIAVNRLMDVHKEAPKRRRNYAVEFLDLLT